MFERNMKDSSEKRSFLDWLTIICAGPWAVPRTRVLTAEETWEQTFREIEDSAISACGQISPELQARFAKEQADRDEIRQLLDTVLVKLYEQAGEMAEEMENAKTKPTKRTRRNA